MSISGGGACSPSGAVPVVRGSPSHGQPRMDGSVSGSSGSAACAEAGAWSGTTGTGWVGPSGWLSVGGATGPE
jgi:hypothetical protein